MISDKKIADAIIRLKDCLRGMAGYNPMLILATRKDVETLIAATQEKRISEVFIEPLNEEYGEHKMMKNSQDDTDFYESTSYEVLQFLAEKYPNGIKIVEEK